MRNLISAHADAVRHRAETNELARTCSSLQHEYEVELLIFFPSPTKLAAAFDSNTTDMKSQK